MAQIREERMLQVYAADAGIENGFFQISKGNLTEYPWYGNISDLNGFSVSIQVEQEESGGYKIVSTATSYTGQEVTIESYAATLDYSYLFDNAISSWGDISLKSGVIVNGNITLNNELNNKGELNGNLTKGVPGWPTADELADLYWGDVSASPPYPSSQIVIAHDDSMGPLYRPGDLDVHSTNSTATLTLLDTFYVTGDLDIGQTNQDFILDLNGQSIFCEGSIDIGGKCMLTGSGCILAVGDVFFSPNVQSGPEDFIFVMSVSGQLQAQPNGEFYGSMAGNVEVLYQPGTTITWTQTAGGLNFPDGDLLPLVRSYIIRD